MRFACDFEGELLYASGVAAHGSAADGAGFVFNSHVVKAGEFDGGGGQWLAVEGNEEALASHPLQSKGSDLVIEGGERGL